MERCRGQRARGSGYKPFNYDMPVLDMKRNPRAETWLMSSDLVSALLLSLDMKVTNDHPCLRPGHS